MELITQSWHWAFSGFMIVVVMFLLIYSGKKFGVSTSFQAMCSAVGGGKVASYFKYDWKSQSWLLLFVAGSIIGGYLSATILDHPTTMQLSSETIADLSELGIKAPSGSHSSSLLPLDLFDSNTLGSIPGIILFVVGGFLIGFGTRWAGGCTSGHAISGLSNLQMPSLIAVVGFFIGGLAMTHFILPLILTS